VFVRPGLAFAAYISVYWLTVSGLKFEKPDQALLMAVIQHGRCTATHRTAAVGVWPGLRAFFSGCTAMMTVEAVPQPMECLS